VTASATIIAGTGNHPSDPYPPGDRLTGRQADQAWVA